MGQTQSAYKNILGTEAELVNQSPVKEEHSGLNFQLMPEIVMLQYRGFSSYATFGTGKKSH